MFFILGADGKEYGPINVELLRQWVQEGRAGGQSQVRRAEEGGWLPLRSVPELASLFQAPPPLPTAASAERARPLVVRLFASGFFLAAVIGAILIGFNTASLFVAFARTGFNPSLSFFLWMAVGIAQIPIRVICGIGLLRQREWARKLAIAFAAVMLVMGGWSIVRTVMVFVGIGDPSLILQSPFMVLSHLWSLTLIVFNVATVVVLTRPHVRTAFGQRAAWL